MKRILLACLALAGCETVSRVEPGRTADGHETFRTIRTTETFSTGLQEIPPQTFRHTMNIDSMEVFIGDFGGRQWPFAGGPTPGFGICIDPKRPAILHAYVPSGGCIEVKGTVPPITVEPR